MPASSVYEEVLDAVNAAIVALNLSGITSSVVTEDEPQRTDRSLPYVSVCPSPAGETVGSATNTREDVTYAVQVAIIAPKSSTWQTVLGWRQAIRRRFSGQKLQTAAMTGGTFATLECTPQVPIDPRALATHKVYVSVLLVRVTVREGRS